MAWDVAGGPGQTPTGRTSPSAGRSTYGIAGTGPAQPDAESVWQLHLTWADGSHAGYGVEGHPLLEQASGVKWLAFLTVAGHDCLYNVWDNYSRTDLLRLISALRFVSS